MNRPSHWILLVTAVAAVGYLWLGPERAEDPPSLSIEADPVVVRRAESPPQRHAEHFLEGRVLDRLGWPIAGATARLLDDEQPQAVTTDAAGDFVLPVPAFERHRVQLAAPAREPMIAWIHPRDRVVAVLGDDLPWAGIDTGSPPMLAALMGEGFLRGEDGHSVSYGVVTVLETGVRVAADENGRFRVPMPDGRATLMASDGEGLVARGEPIYGTRKSGLMPLPDLVLQKGSHMQGYLTDADHKPCSGAAIRLRGHGLAQLAFTDATGRFTFGGLSDGSYVVEALPHRGLLGRQQQVSVEGSLDIDLALQPQRPLQLHVREPEGEPLVGVHLVVEESPLRSGHVVTDNAGRATVSGFGEGPFAFEVREPETFAPYEILGFDAETAVLTARRP